MSDSAHPLCGSPLVFGGRCRQATMAGFPVCWNHVPHWVNLEFANLRRFAESRVYEAAPGWPAYVHSGIVHVFVCKATPGRTRKRRNATDLRLPVETAIIFADMAASAGHDDVATAILLAGKASDSARLIFSVRRE